MIILIQQRYKYNAETGLVYRKRRPRSDFSRINSFNWWNNRLKDPISRKTTRGYLRTNVDGKPILLHRLIWVLVTGDWPKYAIDHINGITDDNKLSNLRDTPDNHKNLSMCHNNTSGVTGVCKHQTKWQAYIYVERKRINLGLYPGKALAIEARQIAEIKYGFHPNHGK